MSAAAAALLFAPSAAHASVAKVQTSCDRYFECIATLLYRASPGEHLETVVSQRVVSLTTDVTTITEARDNVTAGPGCVTLSVHAVSCTEFEASTLAKVYGGPGGNRVDLSAMTAPAEVFGGDGPDMILGGGETTFFPGAGQSGFDGGTGVATVDFADVRQGVLVNLAHGFARGPDGMYVRLKQVENVVGSAGDDTLIGDDQANSLCGGPGHNVVIGGGGNDALGSIGPATLVSGNGHSLLGSCLNGPDDPEVGAVPSRGPTDFRCAAPGDQVTLDDGDPPGAPAQWTIGSHCRQIGGAVTLNILKPMRLRLDAANPAHDYVWMPLQAFYLTPRLDATLTARHGPQLGSVHLRTRHHIDSVTLTLTRDGADYVRHHRPLSAGLRIVITNCPHGLGCKQSDELTLRLA